LIDDIKGLKSDSMLAQLVETIGWSATVQLCGRFGGALIYIPKADSVLTAQRNADILKDYQDGYPYSEIAKRYGVTTTYARVIVSRQLGSKAVQKQNTNTA
jgi:Mor family transcriptional regulator